LDALDEATLSAVHSVAGDPVRAAVTRGSDRQRVPLLKRRKSALSMGQTR